MSLMDRVKSNLREWYALAAERTGEMAKISVRRYDKFGLSREIERQFSELGSRVYHALEEGRADVLDDPALRAIVARISALAADLEVKEREIEEIRYQRQLKQADACAREPQVAPTLSSAAGDAAVLGPPTADRGRPWEMD